jgi:hypothetical protein
MPWKECNIVEERLRFIARLRWQSQADVESAPYFPQCAYLATISYTNTSFVFLGENN